MGIAGYILALGDSFRLLPKTIERIQEANIASITKMSTWYFFFFNTRARVEIRERIKRKE